MLQKIIPDLLNYFSALSLIIIIFYLYFSNKISKDKVNYYLLIGLVFTILGYILQYYANKLLLADYKTSSDILKWYPFISLVGGFGYKLTLYGIIVYLLKFEILKNEIKRENIFLLIVYSTLSFGLYVPYWFIKKDIKFNAGIKVWIILLIFFLSCIHVCLIGIFGSSSSPSNEKILMILYWLGQIGYVTCFLVCIFSLRKQMIKKLVGININSVWVFFIGILHVQFSLNQYIKKHEK
ncbi:hypothetical protein QWZ06_06805 [Chryseobacterium tructae]|uniref:Histidine kinase N-terminal 7TM region domain-containing protein n=1 Tax=Chryseobacterium tructae TaxID=1037380 RepID=A0ABV7XVQ7_9FLAO|nr:hypothetical protein [Chryseobacterium tructae]MDN3691983.1 hypothetical protein [Chryseobacterium tructae]